MTAITRAGGEIRALTWTFASAETSPLPPFAYSEPKPGSSTCGSHSSIIVRSREIDILDPQPQSLHQAQPAPVHPHANASYGTECTAESNRNKIAPFESSSASAACLLDLIQKLCFGIRHYALPTMSRTTQRLQFPLKATLVTFLHNPLLSKLGIISWFCP